MKHWRLSVLLCVGVASSCTQRTEGALNVKVRVAPALKAECLELTVSSGGMQRKSVLLERDPMSSKTEWVIAVWQGEDLPETIALQAKAYKGHCTDADLKLNSKSAEVQATFPASGVEFVPPLQLDPPDATLDADRDGFVSDELEGPDCDDAKATTFPGSVQECTTEEDTDCDGLGACADTECPGTPGCVDPPDRVALLVPFAQLERAQCSPALTVELRNAVGPRAAVFTTPVQLSASLAGLGYFTDASCTVPATTVRIPFEQTTTTVFVKSSAVGAAQLTAASTGLTSGKADVDITAVPVAALAFTNPAATLTAGVCSAMGGVTFTVELQDAMNRPTTASTDLTLTLSASPNLAAGNFSVDTNCATRSPNVTIPAGQSVARFQVYAEQAARASAPMQLQAQLSLGTTTLTANQDVTVNPAGVSHLAFVNNPVGYSTTDICSSPGQLVLQLQDGFGNRATSPSAVTVSLSAPAGIAFHDAASGGCASPVSQVTVAPMAADVQLFLAGGAAGNHLVTASASGLTQATQAVVISSGPPTALQWGNNTVSTSSGVCSALPLTLEVVDGTGMQTFFSSPTAVGLRAFLPSTLADVPGLIFYSAAGCPGASALSSSVTFAAGQASVSLWVQGPTAANPFTTRASAPGLATGDLPDNIIRPGPPSSLRFDNINPSPVAAGTCAGPFTVGIYDAAGNATSYSSAVNLSFSAPQGPITWGTGTCAGTGAIPIPAGTSSSVVYLTSTVARPTNSPYVVTASASSISTGASPLNLQVVPGPSTGLTYLEPAATSQTLAAGSCLQATVQRKDANGNDVPVGSATSLTFAAPAGVTVHATQNNCQTDSAPVASLPLVASDFQKTFFIRVEQVILSQPFTATLLGQSAGLMLTVTPGAAASLSWNGLPVSRTSNVCSGPLTLTRRDAWGNDATADGALVATISSAGVSAFGSGDCSGGPMPSPTLSFAAGSATSGTLSLQGAIVGSYPIGATAGPLNTSQNFSVTVGAPTKVVLSPAGGNAVAGVCVDVTATIRDASDNPVNGARTVDVSSAPSVSFYAGMGCTGSPVTQVNVLGGSSQVAFSFRPGPPGVMNVTAASAGLSSDVKAWNVSVGPAHHLAWKVPPPANLARFTCSPAATVELQDLANNSVATSGGDRTVNLNSSQANAGMTFFSDSSCTTAVTTATITDGLKETSVWMVVTGNSSTNVTATSNMPTAVQATAAAAVTPLGAATDALAVTSASPDLEAGGCVAVTVARQKAGPAPITLGTSSFTVSSNNAGVTLHSDSACNTTLGTTTIPHGTSQVLVYARGRSVPSVVAVTLTATDPIGGLSNDTTNVTTYPLVRRGTCNFADLDLTKRCVLSPAIPGHVITRSFLVFTSSGSTKYGSGPAGVVNPTDSNVECHLEATAGDTAVGCSRGGNRMPITVNYQVVSWGRDYASGGVSVRHLSGSLGNTTKTVNVTMTPALPAPASSFLLFSSKSMGGLTNDEGDFPTVYLFDATRAVVAREDNMDSQVDFSLQVVEFSGATVDRNVVTNAMGQTFSAIVPMMASNRTFNLFTARTLLSMNNTFNICKRRLRVRTTMGGTQMDFSRGSGTTNPLCYDSDVWELHYERVQLPVCGSSCPAVQHPANLSLNGATTATTGMFTAIAQHKSVVFMAGQGPGGQASGEGNYLLADPEEGDDLGALHGTATFASDQTVTVTRALTADAATFSPQVVQFDP